MPNIGRVSSSRVTSIRIPAEREREKKKKQETAPLIISSSAGCFVFFLFKPRCSAPNATKTRAVGAKPLKLSLATAGPGWRLFKALPKAGADQA